MKVTFWNRLAKKIAKNDVVDPLVVARIKEQLSPTARVLEIGASTGALALQLAADCHAIEVSLFSPEMLAQAREKPHPDNLHFSFQDSSRLTAESDSVEMVLAVNVLHLVPDIEAVLAEVQRVLKPGGRLFAQVPTFKEQQSVSIITRWAMASLKVRQWPADHYREALARHGLRLVEEQESRPGSLSVIIIAQKSVDFKVPLS